MSSTDSDFRSRSATARVGDTAEKLKTDASELGQRAKRSARRFAEEQKEAGAGRLASIARAVHHAADQLEPEMPQAARYIHDAAEQLEASGRELSQQSLQDLAGSIGDFARRQPAIFFGGALAAGFVLSRFLRSSAPDSQRSSRHDY